MRNNTRYEFRRKNGVTYLTFDLLKEANVKHGFSTRLGGVSTGVYEPMNLGFNRGDSDENVLCCIAPSICKDCYEVSVDVADEFISAFGKEKKDNLLRPSTFNPDDENKYMLDLWAACKLVFLESGATLDTFFENELDITNTK